MFADGAVCRIECLSGKDGSLRVLAAEVLGFHPVADNLKIVAETLEGAGMVAVVCIMAFEGAAYGDDTHGEITATGVRCPRKYILHFAAAVAGTVGGEVYLQVAYRLKGDAQLQVFEGIAAGRADDGVIADEPIVLQGTVDVAVAGEAESEIQSWSKEASVLLLSEHIAYFGTETGQRHGICILIGKAEVAYTHGKAGGVLAELIPPAVFRIGTGDDGELDACRILCIDAQGIGIQNFVTYRVTTPVHREGADFGAAGVHAVIDGQRGICL